MCDIVSVGAGQDLQQKAQAKGGVKSCQSAEDLYIENCKEFSKKNIRTNESSK